MFTSSLKPRKAWAVLAVNQETEGPWELLKVFSFKHEAERYCRRATDDYDTCWIQETRFYE